MVKVAQKIRDAAEGGQPFFSFEFFPPRTPDASAARPARPPAPRPPRARGPGRPAARGRGSSSWRAELHEPEVVAVPGLDVLDQVQRALEPPLHRHELLLAPGEPRAGGRKPPGNGNGG